MSTMLLLSAPATLAEMLAEMQGELLAITLQEAAPRGSGYVIAAYVITGLLLVGYGLSLWSRRRTALRHLQEQERRAGSSDPGDRHAARQGNAPGSGGVQEDGPAS